MTRSKKGQMCHQTNLKVAGMPSKYRVPDYMLVSTIMRKGESPAQRTGYKKQYSGRSLPCQWIHIETAVCPKFSPFLELNGEN